MAHLVVVGSRLLPECVPALLARGDVVSLVSFVADSQALLAAFPNERGVPVCEAALQVELLGPARGIVDAAGALHAWRVEEIRHWEATTRAPLGTPDPGIAVLAFSRRRSGLARAEYERHYRQTHAPLAREHQPGIRAYRQLFVRQALTPRARAWDAIAELHFETQEDFTERLYASPASVQVIGADLRKFLGLASARMLSTTRTRWR